MVIVLPLLLLLFGSSPTRRAADGDLSSLNPHAACSGHRVMIPPHHGSWVPLYRHLSPCSPAASFAGAAEAKKPSLADLQRHDQLRVDHIHRRILSESDDVGVSKKGPSVKEPVRFEVTYLHDQPVIQVTLGSQPKSSDESDQPAGVIQTVVLDTAADVPWVQCVPCPVPPCHAQADAVYDPTKSSTYEAAPCGSAACAQLSHLHSGGCANSQCQYRVPFPYPNNNASSSSGTYGTDLLAVGPNAEITFRFGCSHAEAAAAADQGSSSGGGFDNATAGVMALGGGPESLASQAAAAYGNAFSYCIPAAGSRRPGFFVLGEPPQGAAAAQYVATPMLRYQQIHTFYRVRLLGIAVNGQPLNVTPSAFAAGVVLDSRTAVTRLPPTTYRALREAFRGWMAVYYTEAPPKGDLDTCYDFTGAFFVVTPRIELVFDRGNVLELDRSGVLLHDCLAFTSNRDDRMPGILGNVQQQTMEVLYDVGGEAVGFRRGAC